MQATEISTGDDGAECGDDQQLVERSAMSRLGARGRIADVAVGVLRLEDRNMLVVVRVGMPLI